MKRLAVLMEVLLSCPALVDPLDQEKGKRSGGSYQDSPKVRFSVKWSTLGLRLGAWLSNWFIRAVVQSVL